MKILDTQVNVTHACFEIWKKNYEKYTFISIRCTACRIENKYFLRHRIHDSYGYSSTPVDT